MKTKQIKISSIQMEPSATIIVYKEQVQDEQGNEIEISNNDIRIKSDRPVHPDFDRAMGSLNHHLAILCEQFNMNQIVEQMVDNLMSLNEVDPAAASEAHAYDILSKTFCNGIVFKKEGSSQTVVLKGTRVISTGMIELSSPEIVPGSSMYKYINELRSSIEEIKHEAAEYLNGKSRTSNQLDIFENIDMDHLKQKLQESFADKSTTLKITKSKGGEK